MTSFLIALALSFFQPIHSGLECSRSAEFGGTSFCLPEIQGLKECYPHPKVKLIADATRGPGNTIMGFYLADTTYAKVDQLDQQVFDNYGKMFSFDGAKNMVADQAGLDELANVVSSQFVEENWETIKEKIEGQIDFANFSQPVLLEKYALGEKARVTIAMLNISTSEIQKTVVMPLTMMNLKNRYIAFAYYRFYENPETIQQAKRKNEEIIARILEENNN